MKIRSNYHHLSSYKDKIFPTELECSSHNIPHRVRVLEYSSHKDVWEERGSKVLPNLYTVTALAWKRDGSHIACGSLCGSVELFDCVLRYAVFMYFIH